MFSKFGRTESDAIIERILAGTEARMTSSDIKKAKIVRENTSLSNAVIADYFHIPIRTYYDQMKKLIAGLEISTPGRPRIMNAKEHKTMTDWIITKEKALQAVKPKEIRKQVYQLVFKFLSDLQIAIMKNGDKELDFENFESRRLMPSGEWTRKWILANNMIHTVTEESMEHVRVVNCTPNKLTAWFNELDKWGVHKKYVLYGFSKMSILAFLLASSSMLTRQCFNQCTKRVVW
jgi:DNA-binding transcriptional regulator YiaG